MKISSGFNNISELPMYYVCAFLILISMFTNTGCDIGVQNTTLQSKQSVKFAINSSSQILPPLDGDAQIEMAALLGGTATEVDLRLATPSVDNLKALPQSLGLKTLTIRTLLVTRDHIDVAAEKFPNLESLDLFKIEVTPDVLRSIPKLRSLKRLDISERGLNDAAIQPLEGLSLTSLGISRTAVTDEGMQIVGTLKGLENLDIHETRISDKGVQYLGELTSLQKFNIGYTQITDLSCKTISKMDQLTFLEISRTNVTDSGIKELSNLKKLDWLSASCPVLTDQCLDTIVSWPKIDALDLWDTKITDKGLAILGKSLTLTSLQIGRTQVTDAGLVELAKVPLKSLNLSATKTTVEGINRLKAVIPNLEVYKFGRLQ